MEKDYLTQLVAEGKSIRQISKIVNKSNGSVRHWLRKYNLTTYKPPKYVDNCKFCNVKLTTENTYDSKKRWSCKSCTNKYRNERFVLTKHKMVEYKGGKCICCGFDKHYSALDFHHLDPNQKDSNISQMKGHAKNIAAIKSVDPYGKSGASSPTTNVGGQAPSFNIVGATETSQLAEAVGSQTQQPIQAYVVANDVTTAQSLEKNIVEGATI